MRGEKLDFDKRRCWPIYWKIFDQNSQKKFFGRSEGAIEGPVDSVLEITVQEFSE